MSWLLVPYALQAYNSGQISTNAGGLIIWPARAILALGFALLIAKAISEIIKKIGVMMGLIADPHTFTGHHGAAEAFVEEEGI
jgi:TRAP-type mannitol/chloroaromatic compound transport system permease small subunit